MPGWKIQPAKRVDLPEDVADGLWISIHHPKMLPFDAFQKFVALAPAKNGQEDVAGFDLEKGRDLASVMILDWNLPGADGAILKTPSEDESVWRKIPAMPVIMAVFNAMAEGVATGIPDPNSSNGSANS